MDWTGLSTMRQNQQQIVLTHLTSPGYIEVLWKIMKNLTFIIFPEQTLHFKKIMFTFTQANSCRYHQDALLLKPPVVGHYYYLRIFTLQVVRIHRLRIPSNYEQSSNSQAAAFGEKRKEGNLSPSGSFSSRIRLHLYLPPLKLFRQINSQFAKVQELLVRFTQSVVLYQ